jgi:hypothetical protein
MNRILVTVLFLYALVASCNDSGSSKQTTSMKEDTVLNRPVVAVNDTNVISNPLVLSESEMKDDSVFADGSIPTSWKNAGITDVKGLKLFLKQLQQWVMNNDKEKLASAIKYPLKNIKNEAELIAAYDKIFTKEVKLSFATINFNQVSRNQNGVMTEDGKAWISQFGNDFKIFAINQ